MKAAMAIVVSDEQRAMLNPRMGVLQEAPMSIIISIKQNHRVIANKDMLIDNNAMVKIGTKEPEPITLTANSVAGDIAVGYNLKISRNVSSQFKLSLTIGYPHHVRIFDYSRINPGGANPAPDISGYCQNMNSVNLLVGFEFH